MESSQLESLCYGAPGPLRTTHPQGGTQQGKPAINYSSELQPPFVPEELQ